MHVFDATQVATALQICQLKTMLRTDIDVKTCNLSGLALSKKCNDVFSSMRFFIQIRLQHPFTVGEHVFRCLFPPAMASLP